jgi:sulfoxide reductase catalytic subunit YedY
MRSFRPTAIPGSEITPESSYLQRRDILRLGAAGGLALAAPSLALLPSQSRLQPRRADTTQVKN